MNVLIIGSKGFIGSHILNYFSNRDYVTYGCDIITDYNSPNYIQISVTNDDYIQVFQTYVVDVCINCSGAASVPQSLESPLRDFHLNTFNVFKLLEAIRKHQPQCKFINLSSAAVYGNVSSLPVNELSPCSPVSPYGIHKLMAEDICKEFYSYYNVKSCSVRIFSAFGEGLKKQLFWDLCRKMKEGSTIEMHGTGEETRDFIHVHDIARALELIVNKASFASEAINVANGIQSSIGDLVRKVTEIANWQGEVTFTMKNRGGDPLKWQADITKLKATGYQQSVPLEVGLSNYYKWVIENT